MNTILEIIRPDDWHLHLRDGSMLQAVTPCSSACFARVMVMPNLVPPVSTVAHAEEYRKRILAVVPEKDRSHFTPLMTLYLTETTPLAEIVAAADSPNIGGIKLYPAGATTNSESGVRSIDAVLPILEKMAELQLPLLVHGEVTDSEVDIFDREAVFIDRFLEPLRKRLPELRVVLEHVTTSEGVQYIKASEGRLAGTITIHHLIINRNAILAGGLKPHYYCLPVAKREKHRQALLEAALSGDRRFFFGSDSAPHLNIAKESACGCAGIFSAENALLHLAEVFDRADCLECLQAFTSENGAHFYGVSLSTEKVRLCRTETPTPLPKRLNTPEGILTMFEPMLDVHWRYAE